VLRRSCTLYCKLLLESFGRPALHDPGSSSSDILFGIWYLKYSSPKYEHEANLDVYTVLDCMAKYCLCSVIMKHESEGGIRHWCVHMSLNLDTFSQTTLSAELRSALAGRSYLSFSEMTQNVNLIANKWSSFGLQIRLEKPLYVYAKATCPDMQVWRRA